MAQDPFSYSRRGLPGSGPELSITLPPEVLQRVRIDLADKPKLINRAVAAGINKVLPFSRRTFVAAIREQITATRANIIKRAEIKRATVKTLSGSVIVQAKRIGLINFKHWSSRAMGVRVQIYRNGPMLTFRHAFIATGANGNEQIFERKVGQWTRVMNPHYGPNFGRRMEKIRAIYGLSLRRLYADTPEIGEEIKAEALSRLPQAIASYLPNGI